MYEPAELTSALSDTSNFTSRDEEDDEYSEGRQPRIDINVKKVNQIIRAARRIMRRISRTSECPKNI